MKREYGSGKKIAFPRYAEYNCALKYGVNHALHAQYLLQPALTRRTEELGARYSPDSVCTPFKTCLGSMIEALEAGADTLIMVHGLCRLGYYGELQEEILRNLGYHFDFVNLAEYSGEGKKGFIKALKRLDPKPNLPHILTTMRDTYKMVEYLDEITSIYYQNCGFDESKRVYKAAYHSFLDALYTADSIRDIEAAYRRVREEFSSVSLNKPAKPLRVGIIGEFFTAMDAFSNLEVEQKLADMGVEVHRWMNVSHQFIHYNAAKNLRVKIADLCEYDMGPTSTQNLWYARDCAERGFDGLIHIKSANCTPEIDIMPLLQRIGVDYKLPTLYLTYDSQTSDVGLMTRLEAFYDMIEGRKRRIL